MLLLPFYLSPLLVFLLVRFELLSFCVDYEEEARLDLVNEIRLVGLIIEEKSQRSVLPPVASTGVSTDISFGL